MICPSSAVRLRVRVTAVSPKPTAEIVQGPGGLRLVEAPAAAPVDRVLRWVEAAGLEVASIKQRGTRLEIVATGELIPP